MRLVAHSWIAANFVEKACASYTAPELEEAVVAALRPTPEQMAAKGRNGCSVIVNHIAHILKKLTQETLHHRAIDKREAPYNLTERGRTFFQNFYSDRHGR
jgi:hypothetical protein